MKVTRMNPFPPASPSSSPSPSPARRPVPPVPELPFNFKSFKKDDWILLSIIAVLIFEGSTDYILLCALGYLFIVGL